MKAVVLAAGEGVRMRPLTTNKPKHMLPIGGKPILHYVLKRIKDVGIRDVVLIVGYKKEFIKDYFRDGSDLGLRITYVNQGKPMGTADATNVAKDYVKEDFLSVNGDLYFTKDALYSLLKAHEEKSVATLAVTKVEEPQHYGIVEVKSGRATRLVEKPGPKETSSRLANTGIYVFSKEIFETITALSESVRGEYEITDAISRHIEKGDVVTVGELKGADWFDIGRPWDLLEANRRAISESKFKVKGTVEEGARLIGQVEVGEGARIRSGAYIEGPTVIGDSCDIGPNCYIRSYTSLSRGVRIGNACEIKGSIVMDHTHIGHLSYVGDSVIGSECNIGAGTLFGNLRFDDQPVKVQVKDRAVDSGRRKLGSIMGDNAKTGINASLMPGVKVGAGSWVGPGVILYKDIPDKTVVTQKQFLETRKIA